MIFWRYGVKYDIDLKLARPVSSYLVLVAIRKFKVICVACDDDLNSTLLGH